MKKKHSYLPAILKLKKEAALLRKAALGSYRKNFWWDGQANDSKASALEIAVIVLSRNLTDK